MVCVVSAPARGEEGSKCAYMHVVVTVGKTCATVREVEVTLCSRVVVALGISRRWLKRMNPTCDVIRGRGRLLEVRQRS